MYTEAPKNNMGLCEAPLRSAEERRGGSTGTSTEEDLLGTFSSVLGTLPKWFGKFGLGCSSVYHHIPFSPGNTKTSKNSYS